MRAAAREGQRGRERERRAREDALRQKLKARGERVGSIDAAAKTAVVCLATTESLGEQPGLRVGHARLAWFRV